MLIFVIFLYPIFTTPGCHKKHGGIGGISTIKNLSKTLKTTIGVTFLLLGIAAFIIGVGVFSSSKASPLMSQIGKSCFIGWPILIIIGFIMVADETKRDKNEY